MQFIPRPHQKLALNFLRERDKCALFLDMGLGKTVVTLTRIKELIDDYAITKTLVIAPKRVAEDTWQREHMKWDHLHDLTISTVLGSAEQRRAALRQKADVYIINRENVQWLVEELGGHWPFDMVVIDELSSFKSTKAKRWRCLKRVIKLSPFVIGLTGTPAPNGYMDLWPELYLIDSGQRLGRTLGEYRTRYFNPGAHKGHVVFEWRLKSGAKEMIDHLLSDVCLSMSKEDWLTLPPVMTSTTYVHMTRSERKLYDQMQRDKVLPLLGQDVVSVEESESAVVGGTAAVLSNKLLQMANGAVYDDTGVVFRIHDAKLDALHELVEAYGDEPLLVFYNYKHDRDRILMEFPDAVEMSGSYTISAWNEGKIPMLLCHPASAGHGLNLQQGGHVIVWFGLPWSLELYQQANARLNRMGQDKPVMIHHLACADTIDTNVLKVLEHKSATQKNLLDALKIYLAERKEDE